MKPAFLRMHTRTSVTCLACGHDDGMTVDHLYADAVRLLKPYSWGPWYCDKCGASIRGEVHPDGMVYTEPGGPDLKEDRAVLLKYHPKGAGPIYLVVKGMRFVDPAKPSSEEEEQDSNRYFYDEGTSPTNYIRQTLGIIRPAAAATGAADDDVFEYVTDLPIKGNEAVLGDGHQSVRGTGAEVLSLFGVK